MPVISLVDDDPSVRRSLGRVLHHAGYTVEAFASAQEFLDSSPAGRVACLVLDIRLDGMSGFELQERLAATSPGIPIVFITAHDDARTRERVAQTGFAGYLPKPFGAGVLLDAVQKAIAQP